MSSLLISVAISLMLSEVFTGASLLGSPVGAPPGSPPGLGPSTTFSQVEQKMFRDRIGVMSRAPWATSVCPSWGGGMTRRVLGGGRLASTRCPTALAASSAQSAMVKRLSIQKYLRTMIVMVFD